VIVTVLFPVVAVLLAASVSVFPEKDAVTPLDWPDAEKFTLPVKPFSGVTVIVLFPLVPCVRVRLLGDADRLKSGGALTVSPTVVV